MKIRSDYIILIVTVALIALASYSVVSTVYAYSLIPDGGGACRDQFGHRRVVQYCEKKGDKDE